MARMKKRKRKCTKTVMKKETKTRRKIDTKLKTRTDKNEIENAD